MMCPMTNDDERARVVHAAIDLANSAVTLDRIATDPDYVADRTPAADHHRAARYQAALTEYRTAWNEWMETL